MLNKNRFEPLVPHWDEEEGYCDMQWAEPINSKKRVNWAGRVLVMDATDSIAAHGIDGYLEATTIVNNWRASHNFPLNTFQSGLRKKAYGIDGDSVVAQRIKRLPSILAKLDRYPTMTLSQMQDIGGCRAILPRTDQVQQLCDLYSASSMKHELHHKDDYIEAPKASGYRGIHLIYRYKSDRKATYNGLLIEMQLRSAAQHAWATAVETVGTFVGQALKSSMGQDEWLDFFRLMGTGIAAIENTPPVPNTPINMKDLAVSIAGHIEALDIFERLESYSEALNIIEEQSGKEHHFYLIELDALERQTTIRTFPIGQSQAAASEYAKTEERVKSQPGSDAVLVSVDSLAQLRRAYPNYFADTRVFLSLVSQVLDLGGISRTLT